MNIYGKLAITGAVAFAFLQVVRPGIPAQPATAEVDAPPQVRQILERSCYSCHSDERRLAWFDQIVPGYWLVREDILTAREHLNFSTIGSKPASAQKAALYEAVNMIQLGAMPLPRFLALHSDAKVTPDELATLKAYLAPWRSVPNPPDLIAATSNSAMPAATSAATNQPAVSLAAVQPEFNGFPFDPDFKNWKPISFTDRGDNNTFRFVLGNDIAIQAARSGRISPWPDGAHFAKIAWQQERASDGLIYPARFVQVELMLKRAQQYKDTDGWGWGRWRGENLEPYGKDARFVNECTGCHMPVRGDDYVYTLPMTTAQVPGEEVVNSKAAGLPAGLPCQPLDWNAITMFVDSKAHTMSALYGNTAAIGSANAHGTASGPISYSPGSVLALVTWVQRDDPHWFGGRIPGSVQSVEFVQVEAAGKADRYQRFSGSGEEHIPEDEMTKRTNFLLSLAPAWLP
jgi:mono/diheme cytochrome c family protein